jgi:pSer/pThr/pTyr-binding forkhead associated (FHA) protein
MPSLILLLEGTERQTYPLGKATLMVGRDSNSNLQLPSTSISANHASIVFQDGEFVLRDNGSPNGSFVNGEKITRRVLAQHDIIRFGEYTFLVDLEDDHGLDIDENKKANPTSEEAEEEKSGEYVPAAKSKRKYSEVVHVPTVKSKEAPALELRLTQPVPYTMVTAVKRPPPAAPIPEQSTSNTVMMVAGVIILVLVSMLITLFLLPLGAREAVANSDGFSKIPFSSVIHKFLIQHETVPCPLSLKQGSPPFVVKLTASRTSRIAGNLHFMTKTSSPMKLRVKIHLIDEGSPSVFDQSIDIKSDTDALELFSLLVKPGIYAVEGYTEEEAFLGQTAATLNLTSYY